MKSQRGSLSNEDLEPIDFGMNKRLAVTKFKVIHFYSKNIFQILIQFFLKNLKSLTGKLRRRGRTRERDDGGDCLESAFDRTISEGFLNYYPIRVSLPYSFLRNSSIEGQFEAISPSISLSSPPPPTDGELKSFLSWSDKFK